MTSLTDVVQISSINGLNKNLASAKESTMVAMLGDPRRPLTRKCKNANASAPVSKLLDTRAVTPHIKVTGIKPALDSLKKVLDAVAAANPDLIDQLRSSAGMLCVRMRKPTDGSISKHVSNHSWGTAIDFNFGDAEPPGDTRGEVPRWVAILVPFFNKEGWFSGIDFADDMHFEVSDGTVRQWKQKGLLDA